MRIVFMTLALLLLLEACSGSNEIEDAVRATMMDPDSAQFRNVERCSGDTSVWTGDVNGKNGFGAYTGFKPFFYAPGRVEFAGNNAFTDLMSRCYRDSGDSTESSDPAKIEASESPPPPKVTPAPEKDVPKAAGDDPDTEEGVNLADPPAVKACWADYCPCDTKDPDFGYLDITLCRKIRMGMPVSDDEFNIGASSRDARRSLREFRRDNP